MKKILSFCALTCLCVQIHAQSCTPLGDETSYGSADTWIGYVYQNMNFTSYAGYVLEGTAGNPQFDQNFGGDNVMYNTNGCAVQTQTFSVRYKLQKSFAAGGYQFTIGGDDGYRLSLDGGATWLINRWQDQAYVETTQTIWLDGSYDLVLEFYENGGQNRIRFAYTTACVGSEDPSQFGTNDTWRGYVYDGTNFNSYAGLVLQGSPGNMSFDQNFGGSNTMYATSSCPVQTETFSVRYRLRKNFADGNYVFQVGGDDGYRLSLDGGSTWVIDRWGDQSYNTSSYSTNLSGWRDVVLEYYENGGDNRISISVQSNIVLKVELLEFSARAQAQGTLVNWSLSAESDPLTIMLQRSTDGSNFEDIKRLGLADGNQTAGKIQFETLDPIQMTSAYYRLKMQDRDGSWVYSPTLLVNRSGNITGRLDVFPTRLSGAGIIYVRNQGAESGFRWTLLSLQGQVIQKGQLPPLATGQISNIQPNFPAGSGGWYLLLLESEKGEQIRSRVWWPGDR